MPAPPTTPIGPEQAALMQRRVSINAASRDDQLRPHLMRAMGCRLSPALDEVTLFMSASSSTDVLADLRANGLIAVVFSEPSTDRTLQLKGRDARIGPLAHDDLPCVQHYIERFADEIAALGFDRDVAKTLFDHDGIDDLVAVSFRPLEAFEQTPGPNAGMPLVASRP